MSPFLSLLRKPELEDTKPLIAELEHLRLPQDSLGHTTNKGSKLKNKAAYEQKEILVEEV